MQSLWWQIFDILGTIAFALSGTMVGVSRRMDIFGVLVLAAATAVGGGIIRDVLVGNIPPIAFESTMYFWIVIGTFVLTSAVLRYVHARSQVVDQLRKVYLLTDAIGLGSFTVTGTLLGCSLYPEHWVLDIMLGVITAVGGGIIRDLLAGMVPSVFLHDVYAAASLAGSIVLYVALVLQEMPLEIAGLACFLVTVLLRLLALAFHWNLPRIRRRKRGETL